MYLFICLFIHFNLVRIFSHFISIYFIIYILSNLFYMLFNNFILFNIYFISLINIIH